MAFTIETDAIYMVACVRPYPPGDAFHWGLFVKTSDVDIGYFFHATQHPGWVFQWRQEDLQYSQTAAMAAKIGMVPSGTPNSELVALLEKVSIGKSQNYTGEWRCNIWVKDAVRLLISKGWIECEDHDIDGLWNKVKSAAFINRDQVERGEGRCQIIDAMQELEST